MTNLKPKPRVAKKEKWNENVMTCKGCGIHWAKIGEQCQVCYIRNYKPNEIENADKKGEK